MDPIILGRSDFGPCRASNFDLDSDAGFRVASPAYTDWDVSDLSRIPKQG